MPGPENQIYIVVGEITVLMAAMRRGSRWTHSHQEEEQESLTRSFSSLKEILSHVNDLSDVEPSVFFGPFLDAIRSEDTSAVVTGMALASVSKFLSYGLINHKLESAAAAVESIADDVTHARFVGTDPGSDEVVLMKILHVLRSLLLSPVGVLLSNESVCEIMQSCIRICFEMRLSELLRKSAEQALMDMVQLLFCRLPQFSEVSKWGSVRKLKMISSVMDNSRSTKKRRSPQIRQKKIIKDQESAPSSLPTPPPSQATSPTTPEAEKINNEQIEDSLSRVIHLSDSVTSINDLENNGSFNGQDMAASSEISADIESLNPDFEDNVSLNSGKDGQNPELSSIETSSEYEKSEDTKVVVNMSGSTDNDYINPRGVRFTAHQNNKEGLGPVVPYGLPCVRELLRFLSSLICPHEPHNSEVMIHIGLGLLTVALEAGADHIGNFPSLLSLVKDDMCRNLLALLGTERMSVLVSTLRVSFLLFESLRTHLKFQLETYLMKLMDIIISESPKVSYDQRELAVDAVVQLWRIPGLVTELYLNYDCDLFCSNLFEDLTKVLSKNAFPVSGLFSTHLLSLDALLAVIDSIETHCHYRILSENRVSKECGSLSDLTNLPDMLDHCVLSPSGYQLGQQIIIRQEENSALKKADSSRVLIRPNRMTISENIPTHEELMAIKHKKKLLGSGTEHFNSHPNKGISFLQENGLLRDPLDPVEVATFLRDNSRLDKKQIGEYVSNRKNLKVLDAFVKSFAFEDIRIDEALRMYLETFRLPGEAPLISLILEHFAEHWHKSAGEPFANNDAAFTLAYAIIMLNVDQHNHNVKKQNNPMTTEDFKKNLKNVNGGQDFDEDMLEEVYNSIKSEEIVMPAEQTGLVRENYLWKVLLRRGTTKEGVFVHAPNGLFDHDLFSLAWGPTVAALSFILDKSSDFTIIQKTISGYRKCAMISAHYGMSDVFDNLIISLCKFTNLNSESPDMIPISLGNSSKAQLAAKTVFSLARRHGDILRDGWKNLLDCVLQLYRAKLLPEPMVVAEDFVSPTGSVSLVRDDAPAIQRSEQGLLSSFYSYITLADSSNQRGPTPEDQAAREVAQACILNCQPESLVTESKFLRIDSLQELIKALIYACHGPEGHSSMSGGYDENSTVFLLELLTKVVLQNKDRVGPIWTAVRDHLYSLVMGASASDYRFLLERAVVGILRLAIRLIRREEMASQVLQSLGMLLLLKPSTLHQVAKQVAHALHELLRTSAPCVQSTQDWLTVFSLMACAGAGARPPGLFTNVLGFEDKTVSLDHGAQSDSEITRKSATSPTCQDRGYTSDSELYQHQSASPTSSPSRDNRASPSKLPAHRGSVDNVTGGWILVNQDEENQPVPVNQYSITLSCELLPHDPFAMVKCCESLAFLVRDLAHITPQNIESCIQCIRIFVEASLNGGQNSFKRQSKPKEGKRLTRTASSKRKEENSQRKVNAHNLGYEADDEDRFDSLPPEYQHVSIQLLDLMHTLHTRAASILKPETPTSPERSGQSESLWGACWCPLLQGIARLCCDSRRSVRTSGLTYLQRALLVHDLQVLSALEWEACFNKVMFPLLSKLMENVSPQDPVGMEETRMRGATLLCKVFLQHLNPLLSLPTFTALWLTILDFMDKYMHAEGSDLLSEAIPESLKNMLLVMDTAGVFHQNADGMGDAHSALWSVTWDRIDSFLPGLRDEVFKPATVPAVPPPSQAPPQSAPTAPAKEEENGSGELTSIRVEEAPSGCVTGTAPAQPSSVTVTASPADSSTPVTSPTPSVPIPASRPSVILHPPTLTPPPVHPTAVRTPSATIPLVINPSVLNQHTIFTPSQNTVKSEGR